MKKRAMMVEVIGGSVVSVAILFIIVLIFSNSTSGMIEDANKKALTSMLNDIVTTQNTPVSGGEHASGIWQLIPEENTIYSLVYIPAMFARKVLGIDGQQTLEVDWKSQTELKKCIDFPESCMCLFKATKSKTCSSLNSNIITANTGLDYVSEITAIEKWDESNLVDSNFNSAQFLSCVPLKESGCSYIDADGNIKPCVIHYSDNKPIVWMYSGYLPSSLPDYARLENSIIVNELEGAAADASGSVVYVPTTLKFETMIFKIGSYSDLTTYPAVSFVLDSLIDYPILEAVDKPVCSASVVKDLV
jgi:hypothetical protein